MRDYKVELLDYGPFVLPKHDRWLIVGSGPSLDLVSNRHWPDYGVISLNSTQKAIENPDVSLFSHFEDVINCWMTLDNSKLIYVANPIHTGFRCVPMNAYDMFNYDDFVRYLPGKVRFFEKESSLKGFTERAHTLFCQHTIASAALSLLQRNGIKEVSTIGIDGGKGHAATLKHIREYADDKLITTEYSESYKEFCGLATFFGITLNKLEESHAMLQTG